MVWLLVELVANGDSVDDILRSYPGLRKEDVQAALHYAAEMTKERVIPLAKPLPQT